jgi:hypothetical protein
VSVFDKAAKVVGDLDSPFYAEERQRDVWNEASAVAFQLLLWGGLVLACAMAWFAPLSARPWTFAWMMLLGVGGLAATLYANRHGVKGNEGVTMLRPRVFLGAALGVGIFLGLTLRGETELDPSTIAGAVVGASVVLLGMWLVQRLISRGQD